MIETVEQSSNSETRQHNPLPLPRVVYIRATVSHLACPLLPFALLNQNPVVAMQQYLKLQQQAGVLHQGRQTNVSLMRTAWNRLFADVPIDHLYFVYAWNAVPGASAQLRRAAGLSFVIATPGPLYTRWLATRPVWHKGELVVWSEAIDMRHFDPKQVSVITLSESRMIRLTPTLTLPESEVA